MRLQIEVIDARMSASTLHVVEGDVIRLGSAPGCDCRIPSPDVAGEHLCLCRIGERWHVRDSGSPAGTYLARGEGWERIDGSAEVAFPIQLRIPDHTVLRIAPTKSPLTGAKPLPYGPSEVESISPGEREEGLLVLDMCGSSSMASANEKMAFHLKKRMRDIVYPILAANHAQYTESTGDGWLATFATATATVSVAREIIARLKERNQRSRNPPINIRIALHFGKTYLIDGSSGSRHGNDLNLVFRVEGVQEGAFLSRAGPLPKENRILCTRGILDRHRRETGRDDLVAPCCGTASLKGFDRPVEIFLLDPGPSP